MTVAAAPAVTIRRLEPADARQTVALLDTLRVSLFGVQSRRLHRALVADAIARHIDGRVALAGDDVSGVVLAAPRGYWTTGPLRHWSVAFDCVRARLLTHEPTHATRSSPSTPSSPADRVVYDAGSPRRTWRDPGNAWRIIVVGTAPDMRGRGIAADLYRVLMRDRTLIARIAVDNHASIRLHRSVGWRLYPDGDVVLAVHERCG